MAAKSRTYLLIPSPDIFAAITWAIMLQSNRVGKLQGLGQCLSAWLEDWDAGHLNLVADGLDELRDRSARVHRVYVGLGKHYARLLDECRAVLRTENYQACTISDAICTIVLSFLSTADENLLAKRE